ncbi:MAG: hypothetical protein EB829_03045 [Nitrosopumilus sp. H8]|nr:MAG: hypothetical protein EB830_06230 [Nitrosopumilus sp. H13]RNJ79031.1 MAG: hypothetical protein EB829_03045 [Nitrosopumilus sp. H8]
MKPKYVASFAFGTLLMILSPVTSFLCLVSLGAYYVLSSRIDGAKALRTAEPGGGHKQLKVMQ